MTANPEALLLRDAKAAAPQELARRAYSLYERFRPAVPKGVQGWGGQRRAGLKVIEELAKEKA
jgi:hypothetical protein